MTRALIVGIAGLIATAIGFAVDARTTFYSFLAAYGCVASVSLGALILLLIMHAANCRWFIVYRRIAEAMALAIIPLVPLFLVIVLGIGELYPWAHPLAIPDEEIRDKVLAKSGWYAPAFFVARSAFYLASFCVTIGLLRRWSRRQDTDGSFELVLRLRRFSSGILPVIAITITFAAFDWWMSLTPPWMSTVFGVYFWAGGFVTAIALIAAIAHLRRAALPEARPPHFYALGRLMLAFTIFWAYIAYAQGFIIWIANKPDEVSWYVPRVSGGWGVIGLFLIATQFVIPFATLLSQERKYDPRKLTMVAVVIVVGHVVDSLWNVLPVLHPDGITAAWTDLAALAGVGGLAVAFAAWVAARAPLLPAAEPRLAIGLGYKSAETASSVEAAQERGRARR